MQKTLTGKHVFIAGAAGITGTGITRCLLQQGATVVAPAKRAQDIIHLKQSVEDIPTGRLITLLVDMPDHHKAFELAETIVEELGRLELAIIALDPPSPSTELTSLPALAWHKMLDEHLTVFFICGRIILDLMKQNRQGMYISVSNTDHLEPHPWAALSNLYAKLEIEMARTFARETACYGIQYHHLFVNNVDTDYSDSSYLSSRDNISPGKIGECIIQQYLSGSSDVFQWCLGKETKNEMDVRESVLRMFDNNANVANRG
jgi:NAD(P)-dependent dehydrogenase (short-subunit alcohol dehydrogenase family)